MDARLERILAEQLGTGLSGLAGSEATVTLRLSDALVNQTIAALLPPGGRVRSATIASRAGNAFDVAVTLARPAFLPPLHARLEVERQPTLPDDPVLALRISGGGGSLLKLAGSFLGGSLPLPPGIRLEQDRVLVDLRALAAEHGQSSHLRYARTLQVTTTEQVIVVTIVAAV